MAAMTGKKKGLLIAAAVLLVIVGVFCGVLFGTELIQQKVIELMCPDTPSSTPRDYDAITAGTSLKTIALPLKPSNILRGNRRTS